MSSSAASETRLTLASRTGATSRLGRPSSISERSQTLDRDTHLDRSYRALTRTAGSTVSTARTARTPGRKSRAASSIATTESQNVICAASVSRGVAPTVGLVFVNIASCEITLSQICDNQSYTKTVNEIQIHGPGRVVLNSTDNSANKKSTLRELIEELVPWAKIFAVDRRWWSEAEGIKLAKSLAFSDESDALGVAIKGAFYATAALSAAIHFVQTDMNLSLGQSSFRIRYLASEDTMMIDITAIEALELIQNNRDAKSKDSLYGLLNHTRTPMGARTLRNNILQPSTQGERFLLPRYAALEELTTNEEMFNAVRKALGSFNDVEKTLAKLVVIPAKQNPFEWERDMDSILVVKSFLEALPAIHEALAPAQSSLLVKVQNLCRPGESSALLSAIQETIHPDVGLASTPLDRRNQRTFAVKPGVSDFLDITRQAYKETTEDVHSHLEELNGALNLDAALKYDEGRRYWLALKSCDFEDRPLPRELIHVVRKRARLECQTMTLKQLNKRLDTLAAEVVVRSEETIGSLLYQVRSQIDYMFRVCDSIALLDMLASFAHLSTIRGYVKPELGDVLALDAARHPILDRIMSDLIVPNTFYSNFEYRFQVVTGSNMSGKSTYIRSVALLQVMAQIGCFVPADHATLPIVRSLFTRVSLNDSLEDNLSTFSVEMREMAFILQNADNQSMVIVDELGRGTSTRDGLAIAIAISEAMIQLKSSVWFATHFTELATILAERPGVLTLHLMTETSMGENQVPTVSHLYKVASGTFSEENYGINLARMVGFPAEFVETAEIVANRLREHQLASIAGSNSRRVQERRRLMLNLYGTLQQARDSQMSAPSLCRYLRRLQEEFVDKMDAIESRYVGGTGGDTAVAEGSCLGSRVNSDVEESDVF